MNPVERCVEAIPAFRDNYIWAVHDGREAAFIDPGDAGPIVAWLEDRRMHPVAALVTHHHADHTGGGAALRERYGIPVYGPAEAGPTVDRVLRDGDALQLPGLEWALQVIATPGHTLGHLSYYGDGRLFCGDTLFSCGCGRLFEGSPAMQHASLRRLAALPPETRVYCAHEYTLANLAFASHVDPDNPAIAAWQQNALGLRKQNLPTLPVGLGDECRRNPFLRCEVPAIRAFAERESGRPLADADEVFAVLRELRNHF